MKNLSEHIMDIAQKAKEEVREEIERKKIDAEKARIYKRMGFWAKLIPFTITVRRK